MGIAAILQSTLLPQFSIGGAKPNLLVGLVSVWSLLRGSRQGSLWALVGGFFLDLLSGAPFGACTISLLAVGILSGLEQIRAFHLNFLLAVIVVAAGSVVYDAVLLFVLRFVGWPVSWLDGLLRCTLPGAAFSIGLVPIIYPALRLIHKRTASEDVAELI